ncbi:MAG: helix-turn-helix transcriptional regulator [Treponema sp.]|nr:helix-turn-helix transcriptional regulator [Candidatus Treponema equifaecale]
MDKIKKLVGETITESNLKNVDCYVHDKFALFIQAAGFCEFAIKENHTHPSYMIIIEFGTDNFTFPPKIELKKNYYLASILSPEIPHEDKGTDFPNYYTIMIDREYFESQLLLYQNEIPKFDWHQFLICHDVLKMLHLYAFESSKTMKNSEITLECQTKLLTHWIIRSLLGENYDMRSVSTNERIGRIQTYIEIHCGENLTVADLARNANMSVSNFNRLFSKEVGTSPKNYLTDVRINKSIKLLRRNDFSISEIAAQCGFSSLSHFSTAFKKVYDMSPSEYREKYQK